MPALLIYATILVAIFRLSAAANADWTSLAATVALGVDGGRRRPDDGDSAESPTAGDDAAVVPGVEASEHDVRDDMRLAGDIVLGGLFPVHEDGSPQGRHCGPIKPDKGIQRLEAMLFALDEINRDGNLLPGLTLGAHILDTCNQDTHGLEQTLKFIKFSLSQDNVVHYKCPDNNPIINNAPKPVPAVIGAASSQVSAMVANVLRLFQIPQISYSSTSSELSDKTRFTYFSRVVPPDDLQAEAMADIVRHLGWTYVSAIYDEGSYGEQGMEAFSKHASQRNICIATSQKIKRDFVERDYLAMVDKLHDQTGKGVIVIANEDNIKKMLKAVHKLNYDSYFAWVASDNWGNKRSAVQDHPHSAIGAITIHPMMKPSKAFDEYFTSLNPATRKVKYKYFEEFWKYNFNCSQLDESCLANSLASKHVQESYVPLVVDAVYLAAHALNSYMRDHCKRPSFKDCKDLKIDGRTLLKYIRTTSFRRANEIDEVRLNENGDRLTRYIIYQYRGFREQYLPVGEWMFSGLTLNASLIRSGYPHGRVPASRCGEQCKKNEYKSSTHSVCCWICLTCNESSIKPNETSCINCPLGWRPNSLKNECIAITPDALAWTSAYALVPVCFAIMGVVATIFVTIVFIRHNKTPVIMASGRELCYMMLTGILFCFLMTFPVLHQPTTISCGILRMGLGLCLSIIYAAILTKTSRLSRIFTSNVRALQRPKFISPQAQLIICTLLILVQVVGVAVWLIQTPPKTTLRFTPDRLTMIVGCDVAPKPMLASFSYIALLIALCTWYAFRTRKIPENFNETKHIGFTMYATCIIWLSFVPIYFGTENNFRIQACSTCMCLSFSGTVALCCFFAPKVYIVLLQPDKNLRGNISNFQKMQVNMVNQQMRFLSKPLPAHPLANNMPSSSLKDTITNATPSKTSANESSYVAEADASGLRRSSSNNPNRKEKESIDLSKNALILENTKVTNSTPNHSLSLTIPTLPVPNLTPKSSALPPPPKNARRRKKSRGNDDGGSSSDGSSIAGDDVERRPFVADVNVDPKNYSRAFYADTDDDADGITVIENIGPITDERRSSLVNSAGADIFAARPNNFVAKPDIATRPDNFAARPDVFAVRPDISVARPDQDDSASSNRSYSPDSYTEPARISSKLPKSATLSSFATDGLHRRRTTSRTDEEPLLRRQRPQTQPILPSSSTRQGALPSALPLPLASIQQQPEWILLDPQTEFDSILSNISTQKGTFV